MKYTEIVTDKQKKTAIAFYLHTNNMKCIKIYDWWRKGLFIYYKTCPGGICQRYPLGVDVYVEVRHE